jgi:hypothetical protein
MLREKKFGAYKKSTKSPSNPILSAQKIFLHNL